MRINGGRPVYAKKIGLSFPGTHIKRSPALVMQCIKWFTPAKLHLEIVFQQIYSQDNIATYALNIPTDT